MDSPVRVCMDCSKKLIGRADQKFCSDYCRSNYHYQKNRSKPASLFKRINQQLQRNRKILASYNKAGRSIVRSEQLLSEGFDPRYFTHSWQTSNHNIYRFCFEFGFRDRTEQGIDKYLLVQWQPYMTPMDSSV